MPQNPSSAPATSAAQAAAQAQQAAQAAQAAAQALRQQGLLPGTVPPNAWQIAGDQAIGGASPEDVYNAARYLRRELESQLDNLKSERYSIAQRLREQGGNVTGADRAGLEARITAIDARIVAMDKQIADADATVAKASSVPGAIVERPRVQNGPPDEVFFLAGMFIVVVLFPLAIAFSRRIWRRASAVATLPQEIYDRFTRVEQSLDTIAIEVERVGEGQRFLTRIQAEGERALGAGPAERIEARVREPERRAR